MIINKHMQKNLVSVENMTADDAIDLIHEAQLFKRGANVKLNRPAYAINMFFENSTRTKTSFQMAELKLGMKILQFEAKTSSVQKGESLYDTLKTVDSIGANVAVIRHPENEYYKDLIENHHLDLGIVNAGDGSGQHPSQCMLDMMTMYEEFGHIKGLKVMILGDISHSRVAHSDGEMLQRLGAEVHFAGPKEWYDPDLNQCGQFGDLDDLIHQMDVVYLLRVQNERLTGAENSEFDAKAYHKQYGLTMERYGRMKKDAIIMHPAPVNRGVEINTKLVEAPNARIFTQMHNGVFIRMAMLARVLRYQGIID